MENKFKKGLILGGLLAAGTAIGFAMTKEGKGLTKELQQDLKGLAKNLKSNLHELEDITKENFNKLIDIAVEQYEKKRALASGAKKSLTRALQAKWKEMEDEYLNDKVKTKVKAKK